MNIKADCLKKYSVVFCLFRATSVKVSPLKGGGHRVADRADCADQGGSGCRPCRPGGFWVPIVPTRGFFGANQGGSFWVDTEYCFARTHSPRGICGPPVRGCPLAVGHGPKDLPKVGASTASPTLPSCI